MARERRAAPSEIAGIGCEFCAYCFDEALIVRERLNARRLQIEAERREAPAEHATRAAAFAEEMKR